MGDQIQAVEVNWLWIGGFCHAFCTFISKLNMGSKNTDVYREFLMEAISKLR